MATIKILENEALSPLFMDIKKYWKMKHCRLCSWVLKNIGK
jgi:hypothetical protein